MVKARVGTKRLGNNFAFFGSTGDTDDFHAREFSELDCIAAD